MPLSTEERAEQARLAAHTRWSRTGDRSAATEAARAGLRARLVRDVDPDGTMTDEQREPLLRAAVEAHMSRMRLAAARARRQAREAREAQARAEADEAAATEALAGYGEAG